MTQNKKPTGPSKPKGPSLQSGKPKRPFKANAAKNLSSKKDMGHKQAAPIITEGRIAKILARAGVASRREVERMIEEGRVKLNGEVLTSPAVNVSGTGNIEVDDKPIAQIERTRLWLYHKPQGLVTTNHDPEGRPTVFDHLPEELPRVMSIGRLDINTEGLLLLTNDGGLARTLELPSTGWLRRYRVRAHGKVDEKKLEALKDGIAVDGVLYGSIDASLDRMQGSNAWLTIALREGKNREIKVVLGALGLDVNRLIRLSYGPFQLGELGEGKVVEVRGRLLRDQLGARLIDESGANFDAPLRAHEKKEEQQKAAEWKPRRKLTESERKERARARMSTSKDDFEGRFDDRSKTFGKDRPTDEERPKKHGPRNRSVNVWMGKGARPRVEKQEEPEPFGREPKQGNWHRPKDKLDPQKSFRRKTSGRGASDAGDADLQRSAGHDKFAKKGKANKGLKSRASRKGKGPNQGTK